MPKNNEKSKGELVPLPTSKKKVDLHNLTAIRREMNSVYRDARNGKIEDSQGTNKAFVCRFFGVRASTPTEILKEAIKRHTGSNMSFGAFKHLQTKRKNTNE